MYLWRWSSCTHSLLLSSPLCVLQRDIDCDLEGSGQSNVNRTCHDEVDLSVCFEDTAILITVCALFWVFAGFKFITSRYPKVPLPFSLLHGCKQVRNTRFYRHQTYIYTSIVSPPIAFITDISGCITSHWDVWFGLHNLPECDRGGGTISLS